MIDEQIKMLVYIHKGILLSHKSNEIMPFAATWTDLEITILSEGSQSQLLYDLTYMWNLKIILQMNLFIKKTRLTNIENKRG